LHEVDPLIVAQPPLVVRHVADDGLIGIDGDVLNCDLLLTSTAVVIKAARSAWPTSAELYRR
jgi:hypothetical protein